MPGFNGLIGVETLMGAWKMIALSLRALAITKCHLALENLALRQQLAVYQRTAKRPRLRPRDRVFWVRLSRLWLNWRSGLILV